jgi:hypothetical protein
LAISAGFSYLYFAGFRRLGIIYGDDSGEIRRGRYGEVVAGEKGFEIVNDQRLISRADLSIEAFAPIVQEILDSRATIVWVFISEKNFMRNVLRTFYALGMRPGKIVFITKLYLYDELLD